MLGYISAKSTEKGVRYVQKMFFFYYGERSDSYLSEDERKVFYLQKFYTN